MTLEKAIETLTYLANRLAHISQAGEQTAARLGIEALQRILTGRSEGYDYFVRELPGETEK